MKKNIDANEVASRILDRLLASDKGEVESFVSKHYTGDFDQLLINAGAFEVGEIEQQALIASYESVISVFSDVNSVAFQSYISANSEIFDFPYNKNIEYTPNDTFGIVVSGSPFKNLFGNWIENLRKFIGSSCKFSVTVRYGDKMKTDVSPLIISINEVAESEKLSSIDLRDTEWPKVA